MKSYIERAIDLAKSQRRAEESRKPAESAAVHAPREPRSRRSPQPAPPAQLEHATIGAPAIDLMRAPVIAVESGVLRQNRVLVESDSRNPAEFAYRMLRTRVMRQMRTNGWTRLGITAPRASEGKTLTAINLAIAIAAERVQPVVLVDLDLRRPRIHRYLGVPDDRFTDVSDYLEGRTSSIEELFVALGDHSLNAILGGRPIDRSSDLLASPHGQSFLSDLSRRLPGALLIFDLPPLLSTDDPLVVAPMIDAILLVIAEHGTARDDVASAAELLSEFNVLGAVLNKSAERGDQSYYAY